MKKHDTTSPAARRILRLRTLAAELGVHRTTILRWIREGLFPTPIRLGPNCVGFLASDVDEFLASRKAAA